MAAVICGFCGQPKENIGLNTLPICRECYIKIGEDKYDNLVLQRGL